MSSEGWGEINIFVSPAAQFAIDCPFANKACMLLCMQINFKA